MVGAAFLYRRLRSLRDLRLRRTGERLGRIRPRPLAWSLRSLRLPRRAPPPSLRSGDFARRERGAGGPETSRL